MTGSFYYLNQFIGRNLCAADLLLLRCFPDAKEITESFGMYWAIIKELQIEAKNEHVHVYCIGDGARPRTAALCAFKSKWTAYAIDPNMKDEQQLRSTFGAVERLYIHADKGEDLIYALEDPDAIMVFVFCHSHASLSQIFKNIYIKPNTNQQVHLISMPCCIPDDLQIRHESYFDEHIASPKNQINIYKNLQESIIAERNLN
jgi:hypothetical protein